MCVTCLQYVCGNLFTVVDSRHVSTSSPVNSLLNSHSTPIQTSKVACKYDEHTHEYCFDSVLYVQLNRPILLLLDLLLPLVLVSSL